MTSHPRSDWTQTPAADANPWPDTTRIRGSAIHWNGPAVPKSALTDPRSYLEGVRRFHTAERGWSDIAYNWAVDHLGNDWELRGLDFRSAANGDETVNDEWVAILGIVGEGQEPTPAMLDGIARVVARQRAKFRHAHKIKGHMDVRPSADGQPSTECPGPSLELAVNSGRLVPTRKPSQEDTVTKQDIEDIAAAVKDAIVADLKDTSSSLATALRNNARIADQAELADERNGDNPGQVPAAAPTV